MFLIKRVDKSLSDNDGSLYMPITSHFKITCTDHRIIEILGLRPSNRLPVSYYFLLRHNSYSYISVSVFSKIQFCLKDFDHCIKPGKIFCKSFY